MAVPPPAVPLSFLAVASLGLIACGGAWIWARGAAAGDPTSDPVVAAVHFGVLATLSMGVLGATHQFTPVITGKPLRSVGLARATFLSWLGASWLLPLGVATEQLAVTATSGALAGVAVVLLAVNLSSPLAVRGKGTPVTALRMGVAGALLTGFLGIAFVGDRQGNWFDLAGHVDLAMGVLGLFGWLGITYIGVAEKLWPMFMLAHVPGRHLSGRLAVWGVATGVVLLTPGLGWGLPQLAWPGAGILAAGLAAHLVSLATHILHRRRRADLHLVFVVTSAGWLFGGAGLALAATLTLPRDHHAGMALAAGAMAAFGGWLLEALVGHAHKVVPFVVWSALRSRGVRHGPQGKPLMFADLYDHTWAAASYGSVTAGIAALCGGLAGSFPVATAVGGALLLVTGLVTAANLSVIPTRMLAARAVAVADAKPSGHEEAPTAAEADPTVGSPDGTGTAAATGREQAANRGPRGPRPTLPTTLSLVAVALASVAVVMAATTSWSRGSTPAAAPDPTAAASGGSAVAATGRTTTVDVSLGQFYVKPSSVKVPAGNRLVLHVVNDGDMDHDLQLEGGQVGTGMLSPGQHRTADYGIVRHAEQAWCTVPGHRALGMVLDITVAGTAPRDAGKAAASSATTESSSHDATIDFSATPPAGWHAFDPTLAPATGSTVHRVTLVAEDERMQVAPGVTQDMWTFGGQVPAPTLRGHIGDVFDVTLVNHTGMDHSIDFHAANEPMEDMPEVAPGQSFTYQFKAQYAGIFLYHCGTAPVIEHLADGMYGAVIIDPPDLDPVNDELLIVQSELYLGPRGQSGDDAKMLRGQPDAVVFNGYVNQYLFSPVRVHAGDRVRIWVLDAGPNDPTSFHVVGAPFSVVFKEGAYLLPPGDPTDGAAQVLDLSPGQGGFVELTVPAAGHYEMLDHYLDHAAIGAAGYLLAS